MSLVWIVAAGKKFCSIGPRLLMTLTSSLSIFVVDDVSASLVTFGFVVDAADVVVVVVHITVDFSGIVISSSLSNSLLRYGGGYFGGRCLAIVRLAFAVVGLSTRRTRRWPLSSQHWRCSLLSSIFGFKMDNPGSTANADLAGVDLRYWLAQAFSL